MCSVSKLKQDENSSSSPWWKKALLLFRVLFTKSNSSCNLTLTDRCNLILVDDWTKFTLGSFTEKKFAKPGPRDTAQHNKLRLTVSNNYLKAGEISRGYKALQSRNHPIPETEDVYQKMKDLHPQRQSILPDLPEDLPDLEISTDEVKSIVGQTKNSVTNCPITSLRYEHLKKMIGQASDPNELKFLDSLTWMINSIANGKVPDDIATILRSTQAAPIAKKDNNIRPLGLRDGLVNITSKCVLKNLQEDTFKIFDGINFALAGPKKMDELIALIAHAFRLKPEHDRLFIDCTNAFNQVDRAEAAKAIISMCPKLAKYYYFLYQENSNIWIRENEDQWTTISGSQGGVQGCVQAPIVFGFGSLTPYTQVKTFLDTKEDSQFGAFLDDSVISAAHDDTVEALNIFKRLGPQHGLHLNYGENKTVVLLGKCEDDAEVQQRIAAYAAREIPLTNIKIHPDNNGVEKEYGYIHLGVPVGSEIFKHDHLHSLVDKFIETCECDEIVEEAQSKWVYLLWVVRQKFPFWFRHMSPEITSTVEEKVETHMRNKFETVIGQNISDREWARACLPTKNHGCGLGKKLETPILLPSLQM